VAGLTADVQQRRQQQPQLVLELALVLQWQQPLCMLDGVAMVEQAERTARPRVLAHFAPTVELHDVEDHGEERVVRIVNDVLWQRELA